MTESDFNPEVDSHKRIEKASENNAMGVSSREGEGKMDKPQKTRRERGTGRIWQDGPFWWIQYYAHGRQIRESSTSRKKTVAEKLLKKRLAEKTAGVLRITSAAKLHYEQMRAGLYAKYRNEGHRSLRRSKDGREWISGVHPHLDNFFMGWRASQITTRELRRFVEKRLAEGSSKGTINGSLAVLRIMFNVAWKDGLLDRNDVPYFPMFAPSKPRDIRLSPAEFERLHAELPEHLKAPTRLAYFNGLRREEIFGLRWADVDWDGGVIRLSGKRTKSGEPRMTPMPGPVLADLKALFLNRRAGAEFVFENDGARILSFRKAWRSALKRAKISPNFVFHGLRYCAASNLTSAGVPQVLPQRITGHATASIFKRYNLTSEADMAEAGRKLAEYVENWEKKGRTRDLEASKAAADQALPN